MSEITKLIEINPNPKSYTSFHNDSYNNNVNYFNGSYDEFFNEHLLSNTPCIILNATKHWECSSSWIKNNKPDIDYLNSKYGNILYFL